jgi:hypothetical protein
MKLNVAALAASGSILWGSSVFMVALFNMAVPGYGVSFLNLVASLYPGYHVGAGIGALLIATAYALVDGAVGGALIAWLYNVVAISGSESAGRMPAGHRTERRPGQHAH